VSHEGDADDVSGITWPGFVDIMSSVIMMFIFFVLITSVALYFHTITYKSKILAQVSEIADHAATKKAQSLIQENERIKHELTAVKTENQTMSAQIAQIKGGAPSKDSKEETKDEKKDKDKAKDPEKEQLKTELDAVKSENQALLAKIAELDDKTKKTDSKFAQSNEQSISVDASQEKLVLFFGEDSISLTEDSSKKYADFVAAYTKTHDPKKTHVEITASKDAESDAAELMAQEISTARLMNSRNVILKSEIPRENISVSIVGNEKIEDKGNWVTIRLFQQ